MVTYKGVKVRVASDFSLRMLSVVEEYYQTSEGRLFSTLNSVSGKVLVNCEDGIEIDIQSLYSLLL